MDFAWVIWPNFITNDPEAIYKSEILHLEKARHGRGQKAGGTRKT